MGAEASCPWLLIERHVKILIRQCRHVAQAVVQSNLSVHDFVLLCLSLREICNIDHCGNVKINKSVMFTFLFFINIEASLEGKMDESSVNT